MPDKLVVYWGSGSQPAWRVLLALEVKKVPYESKLLSFAKGETRTPEFVKLNPRHKVPVIEHGDVVLNESLAILAYLDRAFPETPLFGKTSAETGQIWRYVMECQNHLAGPLHADITRPIFFNQTEAKSETIKAAIPELHHELAIWEERLRGRAWLVAERISAADIAMFPFFMALERAANKDDSKPFELGVLPLEQHYPELYQWARRIQALPGYDNTYPPHWRDG